MILLAQHDGAPRNDSQSEQQCDAPGQRHIFAPTVDRRGRLSALRKGGVLFDYLSLIINDESVPADGKIGEIPLREPYHTPDIVTIPGDIFFIRPFRGCFGRHEKAQRRICDQKRDSEKQYAL